MEQFGFVAPQLARPGTKRRVDLPGSEFTAEVIPPCPYDPAFQRLKS